MNKLILLFLVCAITTGYLQEISSNYYPSSLGSERGDPQVWSLQAQGVHKKPCTKKSGKNDQEEQWIPSYTSRVTHQLSPESLLQPQSLKNEEYLIEPAAEKVDPNEQVTPERRSVNSGFYIPPPLTPEDDDCDDEPANQPLQSNSANSAAIKLIKSCLKRKQLVGSRRSMSNPEVDDSDELRSSNENESSETELAFRKAGVQKSRNTEIRSKDTLLNPRVCYACSTATNPSCWEPDKRTTVKYCARESSCVTKSFGSKNALTLIRDCADSCEGSSVTGIEPKFNKCKICHSDLCNGAFSINAYNLAIIFVVSIVNYIPFKY